MQLKRKLLSLLIILMIPSVVVAKDELRFYFFNKPLFGDKKENVLIRENKKVTQKILKEMGLNSSQMLHDPKYWDLNQIPDQVIKKSVFPKLGEKLWYFQEHKDPIIFEVKKLYVCRGEPSDYIESQFDGKFTTRISTSCGVYVYVPEKTPVEDLPKEEFFYSDICRNVLILEHKICPEASIVNTIQAMKRKFIVIDRPCGEHNLVKVVYEIGAKSAVKLCEDSMEFDD